MKAFRFLVAVASLAIASVAQANGRRHDSYGYDCREVPTAGRVIGGVYHTGLATVCNGRTVGVQYTPRVRPRWDDDRVVIDDPYRDRDQVVDPGWYVDGRGHRHHPRHDHRDLCDHRDHYRDVPVVRITPPHIVIPRPPVLHIGGHHGGVHIDLRLGGRH